jgi:quinohemoprotein ethanol dehydrogenase
MRIFGMAGKRTVSVLLAGLAVMGGLTSCHRADGNEGPAAKENDGANWPLYGRTFSANHYSPLREINSSNISRLKLAWSMDLEDAGSLYTSPVEVNGVLYFAQGYSVIHAVDAQTGKLLWTYDPDVPKVAGKRMRTAWGSRGIAYWDGAIYAGTLDGRLIAIGAADGKLRWSVHTNEGPDDGRYITGAPWVFKGKVVIGHGGADFDLVRGYVTAYDAKTGKQLWRFYTVPGDPKKGFEDDAQARAAKTWTGEWWKYGGGGTVWNAMAYDPKYNRLYIGTGNGTPWNRHIRSPGGGDNLYLCSIVALDADTGKYVWHYQVNPGETWDYNAAMDIELATLKIDGSDRSVLMHAPKNGFFYVIDRADGKLISAKNFVPANWAKGIDIATGRPIENPEARFPDGKGFMMSPSSAGGHNAQPMSYSPQTGLVYIPAQENGMWYSDAGVDLKHWKALHGTGYNTGLGSEPPPGPPPPTRSMLLAWNPLTQKAVWSSPLPALWGGGVTSTGGNLVFIGNADGKFDAHDATTGKILWSFDTQSGISSQPITYTVAGRQYLTVLAGYRGIVQASPWDYYTQKRRVLTFTLDGKAPPLPAPVPAPPKEFVADPGFVVDAAKAKAGLGIYVGANCFNCHGFNLQAGGMAPDLRASSVPTSLETFTQVVHDGLLVENGMPQFAELTPEQIDDLRHYIRQTTRAAIAGKTADTAQAVRQ